MISDLIHELRLSRKEMDSDILGEFNYIMGDLNYRINSTFEELNDTNIDSVFCLIPKLEQLTLSKRNLGNYPDYQEG